MYRCSRRAFLAAVAALGGWRPLSRRDSLVAVVLGSIQDGGLPQVGCYTPRCDRARADPHYVASLALVEPQAERYYLVDATPDLTRQIDLIPGSGFRERAQARRPFDGIFLTHAHIGHYLGLALLGREGLGMQPTPCYCTARMARVLRDHAPWSLLVDEGRLILRLLAVDRWHRIDQLLEVKLLPVPHRGEFSDTVGFIFRGPTRSLLYLPDIDRWDEWERRIEDVAAQVDVALLDGSFYSADEVPGRSYEDIRHPLIPDSMDRLEGVVRSGRRVIFTHLNNTNPVLDPESEAARAVQSRGFAIARAGDSFPL